MNGHRDKYMQIILASIRYVCLSEAFLNYSVSMNRIGYASYLRVIPELKYGSIRIRVNII